MVEKLFSKRRPKASDVLLDPGCGTGVFLHGVLRFCKANRLPIPRLVGVELDPRHLVEARRALSGVPQVELVGADFLLSEMPAADFIIGNPPYVSILGLDEKERREYRARFETAVQRFDLYILFFERAISLLKSGGRMSFITPEKFEYTATAAELRRLLSRVTIDEIDHLDEETFPGLVTYPAVTTLVKRSPSATHKVSVRTRAGRTHRVKLPTDGGTWIAAVQGFEADATSHLTLEDICDKVSCGVATGADPVFVVRKDSIPRELRRFAYPTLSGRQLGLDTTEQPVPAESLLVPYGRDGRLLSEERLGPLADFLRAKERRPQLLRRTCVSSGRKKWYAYHDSCRLHEILRPKVMCKDIAGKPQFWADRDGEILPRHTVYYAVPRPDVDLDGLLAYLNGKAAAVWLESHCQKAANGALRLQSSTLKRLPVPRTLVRSAPIEALPLAR